MTEAMPFLQKIDITFLRPPTIFPRSLFLSLSGLTSRAGFADQSTDRSKSTAAFPPIAAGRWG